MFESDDYRQRRKAVEERTFEPQQEALEDIRKAAEEQGLVVIWTPRGFVFHPMRDGKPMDEDEVEKLPAEERERLQQAASELEERIMAIVHQAPQAHRRAQQEMKELNRKVAEEVMDVLIRDLREKYAEFPAVVEHLDAIRTDLTENVEQMLYLDRSGEDTTQHDGSSFSPMSKSMMDNAVLRPYRVNVFIVHEPSTGAPVVYEDNPNYQNIMGRIEHMAQMGTLLTDFNLLKPGALHQANGGYLILDAFKVIGGTFVWEALKRALRAGEIRMESLGQTLGLVTTVSLEPQPIPLDVKVILLGSRLLYYLLSEYDPDFAELIKVAADFEEDMGRGEEEQQLYARLIATLAAKHHLKPFTAQAVARVIEQSSRMAGDACKLSVHMRGVAGLLEEADFFAAEDHCDVIDVQHVQHAITGQVYRANRMHEREREAILRDIVLIDTEGERRGQVNGLAVVPFGDLLFGQPCRITARTSMGEGHVVDIEREVELGGPTHSKGVLILEGYITGKYAVEQPLSLSASLVFEQSYGYISGDSASSAELYALLSSIAEVPVRQGIAVTGSVNQLGDIQPIGGVNEKIEGYFDVCKARKLTGEQGVIIPTGNIQHLMLRADVVDAVDKGQFHVYPVQDINEGIEILTGLPAGEPNAKGVYPSDSVNGKVQARLERLAEERKKFLAEMHGSDGE